jgi:hypothetical protein
MATLEELMMLDMKRKKELANDELMKRYKSQMESQYDLTISTSSFYPHSVSDMSVTESATMLTMATVDLPELDVYIDSVPEESTSRIPEELIENYSVGVPEGTAEGEIIELATITELATSTTEESTTSDSVSVEIPEIVSPSTVVESVLDLSTVYPAIVTTSEVPAILLTTVDPAIRLKEVRDRVAIERATMFQDSVPMATIDTSENVAKGRKTKKRRGYRGSSTTTVSPGLRELQMELEESRQKWRSLQADKEMNEKKLKMASEIYMMAKSNTPEIIPIPEMPGYTSTLAYPLATGTEILAPLGTVSETTKGRTTVGLLDIHTGEGVAILAGLILSGRFLPIYIFTRFH